MNFKHVCTGKYTTMYIVILLKIVGKLKEWRPNRTENITSEVIS